MLDWAGGAQASVTPFGGGIERSSAGSSHTAMRRGRGAVRIDLRELGRVLETKASARRGAGLGVLGGRWKPEWKPDRAHALLIPAEKFSRLDAEGSDRDPLGGDFATLYTHSTISLNALRHHPAGRGRDAAAPG